MRERGTGSDKGKSWGLIALLVIGLLGGTFAALTGWRYWCNRHWPGALSCAVVTSSGIVSGVAVGSLPEATAVGLDPQTGRRKWRTDL